MTIVQFAPLNSIVQPNFWQELTRIKIDVQKLSEDSLSIQAYYTAGRSVTDRETGQEVSLGCNITIGGDAFDKGAQIPSGSISARGFFKNYNTIEEFKAVDKTALFNQVADEMWQALKTNGDLTFLNRFLLITFADLKKYRYYYWFAFPAFVAKPAWSIGDAGWQSAEAALGEEALQAIHKQLHSKFSPYFLVKPSGNSYEVTPLLSMSTYTSFFSSTPPAQQILGFLDPSALPQNPGWPLRNLLTYIRTFVPHYASKAASVNVLCWRDIEAPSKDKAWKSRYGVVEAGAPETPPEVVDARPAAVGWEKNPQGKTAPRMADLAPMMDPTKLADQAVDLNLKLMRWRILPALDLEKIAATRCLLLGAGTLGCYVARTLMGWGVRTITLADSARVSFSNPVRQPLFEFEDCLNGGKPKAQCAADRLKKIFPGVNASGHNLSIPMPGHPIPSSSTEQATQDIALLEQLFDEHDAVFLLMDSRESRWLPTVLGAAKGKIVMNAALGFDTYLVMRHGSREHFAKSSDSSPTSPSRLGCYYCNDVVAPADSLTDRTLDQMCTVTRPGLASIAAATAVELMVSLIQHPDGVKARAPPPPAKDATLASTTDSDGHGVGESVLGLIPHQLRGFLAQFRTLPIVGAAYDRCTGCSETVIQAYLKEGATMLLRACNEAGYLEALTGLDKLHDEGDAALEDVEWADEEDEGDM